MDKRIVIYKSKNKAIIALVCSLLLGVIGWVFLHFLFQQVIGWSLILLAVLCLIFSIGSLWDKKPYIVLTEYGITEMTSIKQEIEWDAIRHVDEFYYRGLYFIRLLLDRDYKPTLIQPTWFWRLDRIYAKEGYKAIFIRMGFLEVTSFQLAQLIRKMVQTDSNKRGELLNSIRLNNKKLTPSRGYRKG